MPHHTRVNPANANQIGPSAPDSTFLPEFTFHHGHVDKVYNTQIDVTGTVNANNNFPNDVAQTIAVSPTFEGVINSAYIKNKIICQPLLRGISDSIATGDSVIYTMIGDIFYYLGPLNTTNNPNYTPDQFRNSVQNNVVVDSRKFDENGYNINYVSRLIKKATKEKSLSIDRPYNIGIGDIGTDAELESAFSDLTLEGRQNNSIQIGARFANPHIIINNNAGNKNNGSLLGMLSIGNFLENHINFTGLSVDKLIDKDKEEGKEGYIGEYVGVGNDSNDEEGIPRQDKFNINYGSPQNPTNIKPDNQTEFDQIIMFSDRITFDAQNNDLTMSALRNINVGSGQNISITSKKHTLIQSENIYLGEKAKNKTEPIVLGEQLRILLEQVLNILSNAHALVQGVPLPLVDATGAPLNVASGPLVNSVQSLTEIIQSLEERQQDDNGVYQDGVTSFLSKHHFIETNRS